MNPTKERYWNRINKIKKYQSKKKGCLLCLQWQHDGDVGFPALSTRLVNHLSLAYGEEFFISSFLALLTGIVTIMQSTRLCSISEWRILINNNDPFQRQASIHLKCQFYCLSIWSGVSVTISELLVHHVCVWLAFVLTVCILADNLHMCLFNCKPPSWLTYTLWTLQDLSE